MKPYTKYVFEPGKGYIIVFEGVDGSGKTTLAKLLESHLSLVGYDVTYVRNPGGTKFGEGLRKLLLTNDKIDNIERALLFTAAMYDSIKHIILPAYKKGHIVILDRFYHSLYIYQEFYKAYDTENEIKISIFNNLRLILTAKCKSDYLIYCKPSIDTYKKHLDEREDKDIIEDDEWEILKKRYYLYDDIRLIDLDTPIKNIITINTDANPRLTFDNVLLPKFIK